MRQLIYASAATVNFTAADLRDLLAEARENNTRLGISGMLIFDEGSFLQILEGPEQAVAQTYARIEADDRHGEVRLLLDRIVEAPSFPEWKMGFFDGSDGRAADMAGYSDFLRSGGDLPEDDGDRARAVLLQFREGRWRQSVEQR